jgi:hypothetical protein
VLKSLFAWVFLVLVIPNISPFLAAELYPIPSAAKIEQESFMIQDVERDEVLRKRWGEILEARYQDLKPIVALGHAEITSRIKTDPALRERYEQYSREYDEIIRQVNQGQREKADKISETFRERSKNQEQLAMLLTSFSPSANFVFAATDITETGIEADNYWARQAGEYSSEMGKYAQAQYQKEKEKNPAYDSNDYLDLRARPRFQYGPSGMADRVQALVPQAGMLLLFNLIFLAGAFVSFIRYDVR